MTNGTTELRALLAVLNGALRVKENLQREVSDTETRIFLEEFSDIKVARDAIFDEILRRSKVERGPHLGNFEVRPGIV